MVWTNRGEHVFRRAPCLEANEMVVDEVCISAERAAGWRLSPLNERVARPVDRAVEELDLCTLSVSHKTSTTRNNTLAVRIARVWKIPSGCRTEHVSGKQEVGGGRKVEPAVNLVD